MISEYFFWRQQGYSLFNKKPSFVRHSQKEEGMILIAKLKVKDGQGKVIEEAFNKVFPQVEKEEGTLAYTLAKSMADPNEYVVYEKYKNDEALSLHSAAPYIQELFVVFGSILDGEPELPMYEEIGSIKR